MSPWLDAERGTQPSDGIVPFSDTLGMETVLDVSSHNMICGGSHYCDLEISFLVSWKGYMHGGQGFGIFQ